LAITSIRDCVCRSVSARARTSLSFSKSQTSPTRPISVATALALASLLPVMTTVAPVWVSAVAAAFPMPPEPPVMMTSRDSGMGCSVPVR